jgi:hypothetical protein
VSGAAEQAKESAGGALSSLVQGAKEGFVGAYDKVAAVLVGECGRLGVEGQELTGRCVYVCVCLGVGART